MQEAYIIGGLRTAFAKAGKGGFRFMRSDDLAIKVIKALLEKYPQLDKKLIDDVLVGNAVPEAEQGLQIGRMIALEAVGIDCAGMTMNRYCASGLETIATATAKIRSGQADCIIAGGTESMSLVPTVGWKTVPNYNIAKQHDDYYLSMGLTAEAVAKEYKISREAQDEFSFHSHQRAVNALEKGLFKEEILPIEVEEIYLDSNMKRQTKKWVVDTDEGPRKDTSIDALAKLKPVFSVGGTVTAGNSSQTTDGAAFVIVMSEKLMNSLGLIPMARLVNCASAGVHPRIMGVGPSVAIPKVLKQAGLQLSDIDVIELNEAFAAQSLAVINELGLDLGKTNKNGGAISLGHPLGCSLARLTLTSIYEMQRTNGKYSLVSACVGGGQGIAGVFERL
jgi:acetyl-CoA acyltransferase